MAKVAWYEGDCFGSVCSSWDACFEGNGGDDALAFGVMAFGEEDTVFEEFGLESGELVFDV